MIRKLFFSALFSLSVTVMQAQMASYHLVIFGGTSNYQGDLQASPFTFQQSHPAFGFGATYEITDQLSARANFSFGTVSGDDKKSTDKNILERNLNFSSPITEGQLGLEYDFINLYEHHFTPYLFTGLAVYHFNPSTIDSAGNRVDLQPLGTEGEGFYKGEKKYNLTQLAIPIGGGFKYAINNNVRIGIEVGFRKLFTDYLDDVSENYVDRNLLLQHNGPEAVQLAFRGNELNTGLTYPPNGTIRGNPKSKDWYYFSVLTLSFRLSTVDDYTVGNKSNRGCPSRVL
jgi:hypothetical protein